MEEESEYSCDFNSEDFNGFFYTADKHIKKMDDELIISKIIERYPDFADKDNENLLKQVLVAIAYDTRFINSLSKELEFTPIELFGAVYRKYSFLFTSCFTTRIHNIVKNRSYGKNTGRKISKRTETGNKKRTRKSSKRKV